jgi:pyrroloquinoline quinone biosynthesis protein B
LRVVILGSAAGGGVPQWNCGCVNCRRARDEGTDRSQSAVAISADGERWVLLNASPDLRGQVASHSALWPRGSRETPISAVVLTDGEIDHTLGLLLLREGDGLAVYAPEGVRSLLSEDWPLYPMLSGFVKIEDRLLQTDVPVPLADRRGADLGIECLALGLGRGAPRYARKGHAGPHVVGLRLRDRRTGGVLAYVPAAGAIDSTVMRLAKDADLLLLDGTFWSDDEMETVGLRGRSALGMGHMPVGGPSGTLQQRSALGARRVVLVHMNNTNPILQPDSAERLQVVRSGVEISEDGMEFEL